MYVSPVISVKIFPLMMPRKYISGYVMRYCSLCCFRNKMTSPTFSTLKSDNVEKKKMCMFIFLFQNTLTAVPRNLVLVRMEPLTYMPRAAFS